MAHSHTVPNPNPVAIRRCNRDTCTGAIDIPCLTNAQSLTLPLRWHESC